MVIGAAQVLIFFPGLLLPANSTTGWPRHKDNIFSTHKSNYNSTSMNKRRGWWHFGKFQHTAPSPSSIILSMWCTAPDMSSTVVSWHPSSTCRESIACINCAPKVAVNYPFSPQFLRVTTVAIGHNTFSSWERSPKWCKLQNCFGNFPICYQ